MRLTTCVQQFFDLYHFRIKGSSQRTIKAYREALALFLPFAAKYYSIKIASLANMHIDHVVPKSKGSEDSIFNYVLSCSDINFAKGHRFDVKKNILIVVA